LKFFWISTYETSTVCQSLKFLGLLRIYDTVLYGEVIGWIVNCHGCRFFSVSQQNNVLPEFLKKSPVGIRLQTIFFIPCLLEESSRSLIYSHNTKKELALVRFFPVKYTTVHSSVALSKVEVKMTVKVYLNSALRLNDEAVLLVLAGQERKALSKLQQAIVMVKRNLQTYIHRSEGKCKVPKGLFSPRRSSDEIHTPLEMIPEQLDQDSVQLSGLANLQCYVYDRAFRVPVEDLLASTIEHAAQLGSAIIVFNMALVLHRECLLNNRTLSASKSLAFYSIALQLLQCSSGSATSTDYHSSLQGIAGAIQLAALNNTAQLHFEVGEYDHAARGFGHLANLVTTIDRAHLVALGMTGVVMNILCLKTGLKFAPAA
jgi:hypothetical protein